MSSKDKKPVGQTVDSEWSHIYKTHYNNSSEDSELVPLQSQHPPFLGVSSSYCNGDELHSSTLRKSVNESEDIDLATELNKLSNPDDPITVTGSAEEQAFNAYAKQSGKDKTSQALQKKDLILENFKNKMAVFPKHLSYEGSVVLCVLLSMSEIAYPHISNLPMVDQVLIRSLLPANIGSNIELFEAKFDDRKDFLLKFTTRSRTESFDLTMFNSVAHPRPEDLKDAGTGVVPIEKDGDKIAVGGKILLNKKGIKRLIGVEPPRKVENTTSSNEALLVEESPKRQPVSGRNAFEIRSDIMQMALDYSISNKSNLTPEEIVEVARKFYQFVENRR